MKEFETNKIYNANSLELMKEIPDNSVDLAFCDPPYNLDKAYNDHDDTMDEEEYVEWCNEWLAEYQRILKEDGSLVVVNIPRWAIHHADFLSERMYFHEWISWDALSVPRGYMMPAHYSILHFSNSPEVEINEVESPQPRNWCIRPKCKEKQKELEKNEPLTEVWTDIHRVKHSGKRDNHPCQLPVKLMERIINLYTETGDTVIDCMVGTGTTAIASKKLGRKYIGIDIDEEYVEIAREKLKEVEPTLESFE